MSTGIVRTLRLAAASLPAAAVAVLVAGIIDARHATSLLGFFASIGFTTMLAWPVVWILALVVRLMWFGWQPAAVVAQLTDDTGGAPRLAAWLTMIILSIVGLTSATFKSLRWQAVATGWKPLVVALLTPLVVIGVALAIVTLSRPAYRIFVAGWGRLDRRLARKSGRSPLTPTRLIVSVLVLILATIVSLWFFVVRPSIGYLRLDFLIFPAVAFIVCVLAHRVAARTPMAVSILVPVLALCCVGAAFTARRISPLTVINVWASPAAASDAIDLVYDLESIRSDIQLVSAKPSERPGIAHHPVILITIDTVREDHTPLAGATGFGMAPRASMPTLSQLASRGAVFTHAYSPGNVTRRSIPSIAMGLSPTRVHGKVAGWSLRLDPRHVLLAERFRAAGYDTAGFFCCASFWEPAHRLGIGRGIDHLYIEPDGKPLSAAAAAWITARSATHPDKPLFMWMHFIEPHNWVHDNEPNTDDERRMRYDRVLTEVDKYVGNVIAAFDGLPEDQQPIIAITADHGEGLGDHGSPHHSTDVYNSQIHVPLVIAGPGITARRIDETVELVDLAPTLLDLAGFVPPGMPEMDGVSVADLATGARPSNPSEGYAFSTMVADRSVAASERAIISGQWKMIENTTGGYELYDLSGDPREAHDLAKLRADKFAEMKKKFAARDAMDRIAPFAGW